MPSRFTISGFILCLLLAACSPIQLFGSVTAGSQSDLTLNSSPENQPNTLPIDYPVQSIQFTHITGEDGISQSSISSMLQDSYGYIWLGTADGLNKFDGKNFAIFKNDPDDPYSISYNDITAIAEAEDGTLWIGTRGGGLNTYSRETGRFSSYHYRSEDKTTISSDYIYSIAIAPDGIVWIGTIGGGLDRYDPVTRNFTRYLNRDGTSTTISSNQVLSLAVGMDGMIWVGTSYGLDRFDPIQETFTNYRAENQVPVVISRSAIYSLLLEGQAIWVGSDAGLFYFNPVTKQGTEILSRSGLSASERISVRTILLGSNKSIWVGTLDYGLFRISPDRTKVEQITSDPRDTKTIGDNRILSALEDQSGIIWLGTYSNFVSQIDPLRNRFKSLIYSPWKENSISEALVWAVVVDKKNNLWIGTDGGGLNRYNLKTGSMRYYKYSPDDITSLDDNHVRSLLIDRDGTLWVGTNKGLNRYQEQDGTFLHIPLRQIIETKDNNSKNIINTNPITVLAICQEENGILWIGTENSGLYKLNPEDGTTDHFEYLRGYTRSLTSNTVWALLPEANHVLWIGTDRGLTRLDTKFNNFENFLPSPNKRGSLSDYRILSIHRDRQGELWIGTSAGLNKFNESLEQFTAYRAKDGLPNEYIYSIQEDDYSRLWISTNKGISRFNPGEKTFVNYDQKDGLPGDEFNQGGGTRDENGYIYFTGLNGITYFHPDDIHGNSYIPNLALASITQGGEAVNGIIPVEMIDTITLTWPKNYFEFTFQNQSSSKADKSEYAYRLDPFETDWVITQRVGSGRYTNLPGGTYSLHIRSTNNEGNWNADREILKVIVIPPVWENRWFMVLLGFVLFGLASSGIYLRTRNIQDRNKELTKLVRIRTKEIDQRRLVAEGLRDILIRINSNQSIEESLEFIAGQVRDLVGADLVLILKCCRDIPSKEDLIIQSPQYPMVDKIEDTEIRWIFNLVKENGKSLQVNPQEWVSQSNRSNKGSLFGRFKSGMAFPVLLEDKVEAVLCTFMEEKVYWSEEELELFTSFSDQIALALGNARLRQKAADFAMLNERNRLARDLHDAVTQTLFSASLLAEALPSVWDNNPGEGKKLTQEMRQLTRGALAEMRSLLMELRPSALAEAKLPDLLRQLSEAVIGRTGLEIKLDVDQDIHLGSEVTISLYRIAQEALTNIVKHARASRVWIRCKRTVGSIENDQSPARIQITMQVQDNGCGFDPKSILPDHFGLYNMRERAESTGAALEIQSTLGNGTTVTIVWSGEENY